LGCPGALLERSGREAQWNQVRTAQGHVGSKWLKPRWVDDMLCMCVRIYNIIYIYTLQNHSDNWMVFLMVTDHLTPFSVTNSWLGQGNHPHSWPQVSVFICHWMVT
jgi:hypothetical protein